MAPPPPLSWADAPPYHYHGTPAPGEAGGDARSLWIGGLLRWMDEDYLYACFDRSPELVSLVIKRNKQTGQSEGFGFLSFANHTAADLILRNYHGQDMPNSDLDFRLNWATQQPPQKHSDRDFKLDWATQQPPHKHADQDFRLHWATQQDAPQRHTDNDYDDHAIFVGDLAFDVTDFMLQHLFKTRYPSVKSAKLIFDKDTGRSKGYGFVVFGDVNEQRQAMTEMNGAYCSTRPMRIRPALALNKKGHPHGTQETVFHQVPNDSKLFVGCLDQSVTCQDLKQAFSPYGELVDVKILEGKNCGFVTYSNRASAEEAIRMLNRSQLGVNTIKVSYAKKQDQQNVGHYGRPQCYGPSPFGWSPQDPYAYAQTGHPGYRYYQQQLPQVQ